MSTNAKESLKKKIAYCKFYERCPDAEYDGDGRCKRCQFVGQTRNGWGPDDTIFYNNSLNYEIL